jgi:hypothetical protein
MDEVSSDMDEPSIEKTVHEFDAPIKAESPLEKGDGDVNVERDEEDEDEDEDEDEEPFEALGVEMLPEQLQNLEEMEREQLFKEIRAWNEQLSSLKSQRAQLQNRGVILENDLAKIGTDKGTCLAALTTGYKPNGCAHRRRLPHRHRHPSSPARHGGV